MTSEVDWTLEQFAQVADDVESEYTLKSGDPVDLSRVNRDDSRILERDVRSIKGELQSGVFVGATHADTSEEPMGSEYKLNREAVIQVRITGLHCSEHGHVDPSGEDGVPFDDSENGGLVQRVKAAILDEREFPDAAPSDAAYTYLVLANEANTSHQWADAFKYDFDIVFHGERHP